MKCCVGGCTRTALYRTPSGEHAFCRDHKNDAKRAYVVDAYKHRERDRVWDQNGKALKQGRKYGNGGWGYVGRRNIAALPALVRGIDI